MTETDDGAWSQGKRFPPHKHPAHGVFHTPNQPLIVFLTVCTKDRKRWLADPAVHEVLRSVWAEASGWHVGRYVIMPDHIHLFAGPGDVDVSFDDWVQYWKREFTRRHHRPECGWQTDHWDRRLRRAESYLAKWHYVCLNPVRHGLVGNPDDWPYQGEIHILSW